MKSSSRTEYLRRIDRVVERLAASIERGERTPSIAQLADHAHLSAFHFMRIYRALAGESLWSTVQRLRLQRAVYLLKRSAASIGEIAAQVGYDTPQAFAKAFRQQFSAAPSDVREDPAHFPDRVDAPVRATPAPIVHIEIVELEPFRVAALRNQGAYAELNRAYGRLFAWLSSQGAAERITSIWGVPHHDRRDTPGNECLFDCCFAVDAPLVFSDEFHPLQLGRGRYVRQRVLGSYDQLEDYHDALLIEALCEGQLELREAPLLHRFLNDPDTVPEPALETDVFIPVR